VRLGDGSDSLLLDRTAILDSSVTAILDGGDDAGSDDGWVDTLTLDVLRIKLDPTRVINWENIQVEAGTTLELLSGELQAGMMTNFGTISLMDGEVGGVFTLDGDYSGMAGSVRELDIDTSEAKADTVTIKGNQSGAPTRIVLNNITPGVSTGVDIPSVVTVEGTSQGTGFVLDTGPFTAGGVYTYEMTDDFVIEAALNGTGSTYLAAPAVLDGVNRLPTLERRVGERRRTSDGVERGPVWPRFHGDSLDAGLSTGDRFDRDLYGLWAGVDIEMEPGAKGQVVVGLTLRHDRMSSTVTNAEFDTTGSVDASGFGGGLTATWYGDGGTYVDIQGQISRLDADIASSDDGRLATGHRVEALAAAVEVGHRARTDCAGTFVPQAQLTWGHVDGGRFTTRDGDVDLGVNGSLVGRLGVAYGFGSVSEDEVRREGYVIGNVKHDFDSGSMVTAAGGPIGADTDATWVEVGLGDT